MKNQSMSIKAYLLMVAVILIPMAGLRAQDDEMQKTMDIYGFIMMDMGYNLGQIHGDWYDVLRPTKLAAFENEHGTDGNFFFSVRQTRLGFKNYFETPLGQLFTQFEFEMFGTGDDAGQTTIRLRHAYGELGKFGAGQYWSPFMDIDVFPNTVEYWGPPGMAFYRNVQFRYMPIKGDDKLTIALERPGGSAETGKYDGDVRLENVSARFPLPDLSAEYRKACGFGYLELAGIVRQMEAEDLDPITNGDASATVTGWGLNFSTNINFGDNTKFRGSALYGTGIANYMNDATVDVAIDGSGGNEEIAGVPLLGLVGFLEHNWSEKFATALGYSMIDMDNLEGQSANSFSKGQYIIGNLQYFPAPNVMMVAEYQWGSRDNFEDDWTTSISKVQFSFKYNFSQSFFKKAEM
jgi:DcaP outer membrane protein